MKKILRTTVYSLVGVALLLPRAGFAADVCSQGIGIPPFLSSGARPNLLMVLDNSGSMLDAAYSKSGTLVDANGNPIVSSGGTELTYQRCLDGDYDISEYDNQNNETVLATVIGYEDSKSYGGYFENDKWYQWKWNTGTYAYSSWQSGIEYTAGKRVYDYGNIYVATSTGTSAGSSLDKDTGVDWDHIFYLSRWTNETDYAAGSFVWYSNQLYYTTTGGTSNDPLDTDGLKLSDDIGVTDWTAVDSTWQAKAYLTGDIVTYEGIYYQALDDVSSTDAQPGEDNGLKWQSLRQGAYEEIDATDACSGVEATGTKYTRANAMCLTLDEAVTPENVTSFAARGNFLNWAMASKFDVEKKILTGGKFNYDEKVMVGEHRGCSGSRFLKQVKLDSGKFLSLGVRGSKYSADEPLMWDRIDTTDDTVRLEIIAITDAGFKPSAECQEMIETITTKELNGANWSNAITACLGTFPDAEGEIAHQRPMLNHSLQFCASLGGNLRDVGVITSECEGLYTVTNQSPAYDPDELEPENGAYICFGIYDSAISNPDERAGYVGRCWEPASGQFKTCEPKPASLDNACTGDPCTYTDAAGNLYLNETPVNGDVRYNYICTSLKASGTFGCKAQNGDEAGSRKYWEQQYMWYFEDSSSYIGTCIKDEVASGVTPAGWENAGTAAVEECIIQASIDYCNDTSVPEVIDPSGQAGNTTITWNIPGVLTDSQILVQLGGKYPLSVMKGYIEEPDRPEGIIQSVARDLRLGLMSFNDVGAATECSAEYLTNGIERFCPVENKDGATLLSTIEDGDWVVDSNDPTYVNGKRRHVDEVAQEINAIQATSWTPLGEALYSALGYYTQNSKLCLNCTDRDINGVCLDTPGNCLDFLTDADPVQYWCQDNHILVITEGESTADINEDVTTFLPTGSENYITPRPDECACHPKNKDEFGNCTPDSFTGDGDVSDAQCSGGLYASTYLDDMTWWGQHGYSLYKKRCIADPDGNETEKSNIFTHVVTTGTLTAGGSGECTPDTLMQNAAVNGGTEKYYSGEDPQQLEDNLYAVLGDIMTRASSGAAASVISNSRSGDGAIYQALFWPRKDNGILDEKGNEGTISWVGDIHALFIDSDNIIYEDTNQNGKLEPMSPDKEINIYFSEVVGKARGCYADLDGRNQCPTDLVDPCTGDVCVELEDIKYLWSANEQLRKMVDPSKRKIFTWNDFDNDGVVDDRGVVDSDGETFVLETGKDWADINQNKVSGNRGPVTDDFVISEDYGDFVGYDAAQTEEERAQDAMDALIEWLQGTDSLVDEGSDVNLNQRLDTALRSRQYRFKTGVDAGGVPTTQDIEWRMGDVINSSPITVSKPAENFHLIYRDPSYNEFVKKWSDRRTVVYFGGNDGMLHAVNSGFYSDKNRQFFCSKGYTGIPDQGDCKTEKPGEYNLGEELWAYVPYNLQPHLKCLADKFYEHKYFVDLEPRIADVQIFPEDADHPDGWGTILIGGMRFGGAPVAAKDLNGKADDLREFSSSYFILDITNPVNPKVLGELTRTTDSAYVDLNYTTSSPTIVVMREDDGKSKWYLVMGNGPVEQDGTNNPGVQGKIAVLPLERLIGPVQWSPEGGTSTAAPGQQSAIRIPNQLPGTAISGGVFPVPIADNGGYISSLISMDYNIDLTAPDNFGARYRTDAVYFGTVDGTDFGKYSDEALASIYPNSDRENLGDQWYWNGGGRVFRLVTKFTDVDGYEKASTPLEWKTMFGDPLTIDGDNQGAIRMLMDVKSPVTGGLSAGYDGEGKNFWIYVGTGRFYDEKDKTDDGRCLDATCASRTQRAFFGLKEPIKDGHDLDLSVECADNVMTWDTIEWNITDWGTATNGATEANVEDPSHLVPGGPSPGGNPPGQRGLMRTDNILVDPFDKYLYCYHLMSQSEYKYYDPATAKLDDTVCFPGGDTGPIYSSVVDAYTLGDLEGYIAGTGCQTSTDGKSYTTGLDGWYHVFHDSRERNLSSALLFNKKLFFSTYQPYNDTCKAEGLSYLYKLYYKTGTGAWDTLIDLGDGDKDVGTVTFDPINKSENPYEGDPPWDGPPVHEFKAPVRGLANVGSAGAAGSGGEFYAEKPSGEKRESNKLNWSDRCGVQE